MLAIIALDENVAPDTASTSSANASSTDLFCQWLSSSFARLKKSGDSALGSASTAATLPSFICIFSGTGPPYPCTSFANGFVFTTNTPSGVTSSVSFFSAFASCASRKSCPNILPSRSIAAAASISTTTTSDNSRAMNPFLCLFTISLFLLLCAKI